MGTGVCLITEHDPIVLAKQVGSLDVNSSGNVAIFDLSNKHDGTAITLSGGGNYTLDGLTGGNDTIVLTDKATSLDVNSSGDVTIIDNSTQDGGTAITLSGGGDDTALVLHTSGIAR